MKRKKNRKRSRGMLSAVLFAAACLSLGATSAATPSKAPSRADVQKASAGGPVHYDPCLVWDCGSNHNEVLLSN